MPIPFPPEKVSIRRWYSYRAKLPIGSEVEHRVIIVYICQPNIRYVYATSKFETACKVARYDPASVVTLNPSDWNDLTKKSYIICSDSYLKEMSYDDFRSSYANGEYTYIGEIPEKVKNSIISAICMSDTFTDDEKNEYTT